MCFSATASFLASGLLTMAGVATYSQVIDRRQMMLASIPLLFAVQQAAEGIVWLSFSYDTFAWLRIIAAYFFLFFAFIIWPIWSPLSVYFIESMTAGFRKKSQDYVQSQDHLLVQNYSNSPTKPHLTMEQPSTIPIGDPVLHHYMRNRLLLYKIMIIIGFLVSCYFIVNLFRYDLIVQVFDCHILYKLPSSTLTHFCYVLVTIVPLLLAREAMMRLFGILLGISLLVSYFFYYYLLISIWCFFAALLSVLIFIVIYKQRNNIYEQPNNG